MYGAPQNKENVVMSFFSALWTRVRLASHIISRWLLTHSQAIWHEILRLGMLARVYFATHKLQRLALIVILIFTTVFSTTFGLSQLLSHKTGSTTTPARLISNPSGGHPGANLPTQQGTGAIGNLDQQTPDRSFTPSMKPLEVPLARGHAAHGLSSDGRLEVSIAADALDGVLALAGAGHGANAAISAATTPAKIVVTEVAPSSGSTDGGMISLGTYYFQAQDSNGKEVMLTTALSDAMQVTYHWPDASLPIAPQRIVAVINGGALPKNLQTNAHLGHATTLVPTFDATSKTSTVGVPLGGPGNDVSGGTGGKGASPAIGLGASGSSGSTLNWLAPAPEGYFKTSDSFHADLQSGGLSQQLSIDVPAGPGGLTPPINLTYSSTGLNENHSGSSPAGWVGEGWNLDLGEITWNDINRASCPGCNSNGDWESSWSLSDPFGTSSALIPPTTTVSTYYDDTPNTPVNAPVTWQTAKASHIKIISYTNPVTNPDFPVWNGSTGYRSQPPCFRVWLQNGIMEEYGCTRDSLQFYPGGTSHTTSYVSAWKLDLITDPNGNQIHITYNNDRVPAYQGGNQYPRDIVPATVEWDSPTCHDAQNMCTGTSWQPRMRVRFGVDHQVAHAYGSICGAAAPNGSRCDDPQSVGAMSAPLVESTYVLNDVYVEVNPSGDGTTWNQLRQYQLRYSQTSWQILSYEPNSQMPIGQAGDLLLTQVQEYGTTSAATSGALAYPPETFTYGAYTQNYVDMFYKAQDPQQLLSLNRYTTNDHWETTGSVPGGYKYEVTLGLVATTPLDSTMVPLFNCLYKGWDHFNSLSSGCEGNQYVGLIGYIYSAAQPPANQNYVAIYRCNQKSGGDHFTSTDKNCENQNIDGIQGYVLAPQSQPQVTLVRYRGDNGDHWETTGSADGNSSFHSEYVIGTIPSSSQSGTTNLNGCLVNNYDHMLSIDPNECTSSTITMVRQEGYIYTSAPSTGTSTPVYRCWWTNTVNKVDHFASTDPNCEGYNKDGFSGYALTPGSSKCGPSWNTSCYLWGQSTHEYLIGADNGKGGHTDFTWTEAHNNTHNVPSNLNALDPTVCTANRGSNPCQLADDGAWSRIVLTNQTSTSQDATGKTLTSTTQYTYRLTNLTSVMCPGCSVGMYWGDENDGNWTGYYDTTFAGFNVVQETLMGGTQTNHYYYTTEGIGVYDANLVNTTANLCQNGYRDSNNNRVACTTSASWDLWNAASGMEYQTDVVDTNGKLYDRTLTNYTVLSPPPQIGATTSVATYGNWEGHLVAELDPTNPVAANDVQVTSTTSYQVEGTIALSQVQGQTIANVPTATTSYTYDNAHPYGLQTKQETTSSSGAPSDIVQNKVYVWNDNITIPSSGAPTGTYIIKPAGTDVTDGSGNNRTSCAATAYDGKAWGTGQQIGLTHGLATQSTSYTSCGTATSTAWGTGTPLITTASYDTQGNAIGGTDADANATTNSGHVGNGTNGSCQGNTTCTTLDSTYGTLPIATGNAFYQTGSATYSQTAAGGWGLWVTGATNVNNQTSTVSYDALGRTISATLPGESAGQATSQQAYTVWCLPTGTSLPCLEADTTRRIDANTTLTSRVFYDAWGHAVESRTPGPDGQDVVQYALYDGFGRRIAVSQSYFVAAYTGSAGAAAYSTPDTSKSQTIMQYDVLNRVIKTTDPKQATTTTNYGILCNVAGYSDAGCYDQTLVVDANSHQSGTLTDGMGRTIYQQTYSGNSGSSYAVYATTVTHYDVAGRVTQVQQPGSSVNTWTYDAAGRVTQSQDPDLGSVTPTYDANGNMLSSADPRGAAGTVYVGYDGLNRVLWESGSSNGSSPFATYTYDGTANGNQGKGHLTSETFASGPQQAVTGGYTYTFDGRGRQTGWTMTIGGTTYTTTATYNDAGQATSTTYPDGSVVATNYNAADWLGSASLTQGSTTTSLLNSLSYTGANGAAQMPTNASVGNSTYSWNFGYDQDLLPTETTVQASATKNVLYDQTLGYDAVGNVTSAKTTMPAGTDQQAFCYDEQDRLTWAGASGTPACGSSLTSGSLTAATYQQSYSFDTSNRLLTGPMGTYTYGGAQLHAVTSTSNGYGAQYDAAGDMTCRQINSSSTCSGTPTGQTMAYDALRRLITWQNAANNPTQTASYAYDGSGERVWQQVNQSGTITSTLYIGSYEEIVTTGTSTTTTSYYPAGPATAVQVNGTLSYLISDHLGSANVALDTNGNVTATALYTPYGSLRYSTGTMPTTIGFTGQRSDPSGLIYMHARYYDPVVGQFTTADLVQGPNRYGYVAGNPETMSDPTGQLGWNDVWNTAKSFGGAVKQVADFGLGLSDMGNDIGTFFNSNSSWQDRFGAAVNLVFNVAMDVSWFVPGLDLVSGAIDIGMHAFESVGAHIVEDVGEHALEDVGEHVLADVGEHATADVGEHAAAGAGEHAATDASEHGGGAFEDAAKEGGCNSFQGDTPVATPSGAVAINTLHVGDLVIAYNSATGQTQAEPVQHVFVNHDDNLLDVTLTTTSDVKPVADGSKAPNKAQDVATLSHGTRAGPSPSTDTTAETASPATSETIHTTTEHPFLTTDRGFVDAVKLVSGEHVQMLDGSVGTVVKTVVVPGVDVRYNLTVQDLHSFAVGQDQWVVHNCLSGGSMSDNEYEEAVRQQNGDFSGHESERTNTWTNKLGETHTDKLHPDAIRTEADGEVWIEAKGGTLAGYTKAEAFADRGTQIDRYVRAAQSGQRVEYWFQNAPAADLVTYLTSKSVGVVIWP
jgi:RHS repeat-associated protein